MVSNAGAVRMEKGEGWGHTEVLVREMPLMPQSTTFATF